jgi:hypothetical protein
MFSLLYKKKSLPCSELMALGCLSVVMVLGQVWAVATVLLSVWVWAMAWVSALVFLLAAQLVCFHLK